MKITAVVVAYWPSRFPAVPSIVKDLLAGTRVPDHIIVVNNNHRQPLPPIPGASVINCGWNYTSRGKYGIAMLEPSDYYLLLDDDVSVQPEFLAYLADLAHPECCFSDIGRVLIDNLVSSGRIVAGSAMRKAGVKTAPVDTFMGSVQFVSFRSILRMFEAEAALRLPQLPVFRSVGEDLLIAMANPGAAAVATGDLWNRRSKPQGGAAMQGDKGYFTFRNWFGYQAWIATGHKPFPGPVPGTNPADQKAIEVYLATVAARDATGKNMENKP